MLTYADNIADCLLNLRRLHCFDQEKPAYCQGTRYSEQFSLLYF